MKELSDNKFLEYLEKKVRYTLRKYSLIQSKEKIGVAVSGGKDSTTCLSILKNAGFDVEAITIDPAIGEYTRINLENIRKFCKEKNIKFHKIDFRKEWGISLCHIRSRLQKKGFKYSSCMLCGILKRYLINKYSKKFKFDKLATGHNLDDEAQAFIMNVFRNDYSKAQKQGPLAGIVQNSHFVPRIKPLYLISEKEVIRYSKIKDFPVNYERCPCSTGAYRRQFINILDDFETKHPSVKYNIIKFHERLKNNSMQKSVGSPNLCENCGEPSAGNECKACKILKELK